MRVGGGSMKLSSSSSLASELARKDNTNVETGQETPPHCRPSRNNGGKSSRTKQNIVPTIIPYAELVQRRDPSLDTDHLELYLSEQECLQYLGCSKSELDVMPLWQLNQRKRRANLM